MGLAVFSGIHSSFARDPFPIARANSMWPPLGPTAGKARLSPTGTTLCVNIASATSTGAQQIANNQLVHQANFNASHFSAIGIGTTLYFQASYTDPGQVVSSNFSDGLQITFQQETSPSIGFQGTSSSAIESIGTASIGMQVSSASGLPISVDVQYSGSATRGVDFNGPDSLTLPPGQTTLDLDIQVLSDALYEFDEQVVIQLSGVTNGLPGSVHAAYPDPDERRSTAHGRVPKRHIQLG